MSTEISSLIVPAIVAAVSTPVGAWITRLLLKAKYKAEIARMQAEVDALKANADSQELDNVSKATDILMEHIVKPLKDEIKLLRKDVNRFRRAIEKIPSCPHADNCPVSKELDNSQGEIDS